MTEKATVPATKKTLLVIDDEAKLCDSLSALFEEKGIAVTTATTAQDGLAQLRRMQPDAVLLDLKLPDSSGFVVLSKLKEQFPNLRVVVISALGDERTIQEAYRRGASGYLSKPFDFDQCFYAAMGIEAVDVSGVQSEPEALARVPETLATKHQVLPMRWDQHSLHVAMRDPLDTARREALSALFGSEVTPVAALRGDLASAIRRNYHARTGMHFGVSSGAEAHTVRVQVTPELVQLADWIIQEAYGRRATDIHLGIGPDGPWLHERVDGVLRSMPVAPALRAGYAGLIAHMKSLARLDAAQQGLPQQGRIQCSVSEGTLDLRVSVLPTPGGEHLAIRLLKTPQLLSLDQLGMTTEQHKLVNALLTKTSGLMVVVGPARSGKSGTLYAMLLKLNTGQAHIVTLEDYVEHALEGLTQVSVQATPGLTYADGVRAALQHDHDVLMVGDLHEPQTAGLVVRSALTGRLALAAMHTPDTASTVTRLLDYGIEPYFLCGSLSGIVAQRLVRKLCTTCREPSKMEAANLVPLGIDVPKESASAPLWRAKGCAKCGNTGYTGLTGFFEVLAVDHHIRSLIIKRSPGAQIRQSAVSRGMVPLSQSGWQKVRAGHTSLEELLRVLPAEPR